MIRLFLLCFLLMSSATWACNPGSIIDQAVSTGCNKNADGACIIDSAVLAAFAPTVNIGGCYYQFESVAFCIPYPDDAGGECHARYKDIGTGPTCPSGSYAPNGDVSQCVELVRCANGELAPFQSLSLCPVDTSSTSVPVIPNQNESLAAGAFVAQTIQVEGSKISMALSMLSRDLLNAITSLPDRITRPITTTIEAARAQISASVDSLVPFLNQMTNSLTDIQNVINREVTKIENYMVSQISELTTINNQIADFVNNKFREAQDITNGHIDAVKNSVSSLGGQLQSSMDFWGNSFNQLLFGFKRDFLDIQSMTNTSADRVIQEIGIRGDIWGRAAQDSASSIQMAIYDLGNNLGSAVGTAVNSAITGGLNNLASSIDDMNNGVTGYVSMIWNHLANTVQDSLDSFDQKLDRIASTLSGEQSALSDLGNSTLAAGSGENPLATPDDRDVSSIIKTTVSGTSGCPVPVTADVFGQTLSFSFQPMCDWADIVGKFIMIIAAMVSIRIIASGGF